MDTKTPFDLVALYALLDRLEQPSTVLTVAGQDTKKSETTLMRRELDRLRETLNRRT